MGDIDILFCRPLNTQDEDDGFEIEEDAALELGIDTHVIPLEPLVNDDPERALSALPRGAGRTYLYRGWMLSAEEYAALYAAVCDRGDRLLVEPHQYEAALYLPEYLPFIEQHTPRTRWTEGADIAAAWEAALELGAGPWIVKDHVKSAKELWHHACLIPDADRTTFTNVCNELLDVRGERFERGFVVREFVALKALPYRMPERPVCDEHRLIFWDGKLVASAPYYEVGEPMEAPEQFDWLGKCIDSPFFTADVAQLEDGGFTIIELNDGGVSTLPPTLDPRTFYGAVVYG